jgi:hypothetical protein
VDPRRFGVVWFAVVDRRDRARGRAADVGGVVGDRIAMAFKLIEAALARWRDAPTPQPPEDDVQD